MRKIAITTLNICYSPLGTTLTIRDATGRNDKRKNDLLACGLEFNPKQNIFTANTEAEWNTALDVLKHHQQLSEN